LSKEDAISSGAEKKEYATFQREKKEGPSSTILRLRGVIRKKGKTAFLLLLHIRDGLLFIKNW